MKIIKLIIIREAIIILLYLDNSCSYNNYDQTTYNYPTDVQNIYSD